MAHRSISQMALVFILLLINPLLAFIPLAFLRRQKQLYSVFLLSFTLSLILVSQQSTGLHHTDIVTYYNLYIGAGVSNFSKTSFLYNSLELAFSKLNLNFQFFIFFQYLFYYLSCFYLAFKFSVSSTTTIKILFIAFGLINFVQMGEILRQNMATVLFLYSFLFFEKKKVLSFLFFSLSLGFHHSSFFLLFLALLSINYYLTFSIIPLSIVFAFINQNQLIAGLACPSNPSSFICFKAKRYIDFGWEITLKEHLSLFSLAILSFGLRFLKNAKKRFKNMEAIERLCFVYLLFLLSNLSTTHNFIRFLNAGSPFFVIMFSRTYDLLIEKKKYKRLIMGLGLIFVFYNAAAVYKRTTREGYQSTYLYGNPMNLVTMFTWEYFTKERENPDRREK